MEKIFSIVAFLVVADFGLAIRRPSLHGKLQNAYLALLTNAFMLVAGIYFGAMWMEDMLSPVNTEGLTIAATIQSNTFGIGALALLVMILHGFSMMVAHTSLRDLRSQNKNK